MVDSTNSFTIVSFFFLLQMLHSFEFFFRLPTDIQSEGIPAILGGGDVLMVWLFRFLYFAAFFRTFVVGIKIVTSFTFLFF